MSASPIQRLQPITTLNLGRYEALGELASGGTGTVYLARLQGPGGFERLFAIKVLHKHYAAHPEVVQMLLKEAHLAGQIHHPHVVDTVEIGLTDEGQHYLVMSYVEGASLDDLLAHPKLDAIRRVRLGLAVLLDAMSGLDAVHRAKDVTTGEPLGIVHRDVSPANILIGFDGIGRVADFGIASARMYSSASRPGVVRGTPRYMAPEQATGEGPIDPRSDVFALGAVLWEVITGEPLFDSRVSVEHILRQVTSATIPPPSDRNSRMPEALDHLCLRALDRDITKRYASVGELRAALVQVADAAGLLATPRELVSELAALFEDRVAQRRALVASATRRKSGTQLRAIVLAETSAPFDASVDGTRLGIGPMRVLEPESSPQSRQALTTLNELLGDDDDHEPVPATPDAYRLPKQHWRRWALLALVGFVVGGWLWLTPAAHEPRANLLPPPPRSTANVITASPARQPAPAVALVLEEAAERALAPAEPAGTKPAVAKRVAAKAVAPVRPRAVLKRAAPTIAAPVVVSEGQDDTLPLETNPYRLQR